MLLTIVIPIYNVRKYLNDCLNSLSECYNVILVNDGSTDGSDLICVEYAKSRQNVKVVNKPNGGLADARNFGVQYVDTEYVFFLDSDDRIDGENLRKALAFAAENELDWVQCGYAYDYGVRLLVYRQIHQPRTCSKSEVITQLVNDSFIKDFAWGKIYKTEIAKQYKFPKGKFFEDSYWQYLVIDSSKTFGIFPDIVTYYRQRPDSISGTFSNRNQHYLEGLSMRLDFYRSHLSEYGQFIGASAVYLWCVAESYCHTAASISEDLQIEYSNRLDKIQEKYKSEIFSGISQKPFFTRLELKCKICKKFILARIIAYGRRIYNRFTPSKYQFISPAK